MMKQMTRLIALMTCIALLTGAFAFAEDTQSADAASNVVAVINGEELDKTEALQEYTYYAEQYAYYGYDSEENLAQLKEDVLDAYIRITVIKQKMKEMNLGQYEGEELAALQAEGQAQYDSTLDGYVTNYYASFYAGDADEETLAAAVAAYAAGTADEAQTAIVDEVKAALVAYFDEQGYTAEVAANYAVESAMYTLLYDTLTADAEVTDEDLHAYYDGQVANDQAYYDGDPAAFGSDALNGVAYSYVPDAGYRAVKHILVLMSEEDQNSMYTLVTSRQAAADAIAQIDEEAVSLPAEKAESETRIAEIDEALKAEDADAETLTAERDTLAARVAEIDELLATAADRKAEQEALLPDLDAQIADLQAVYQPKIDEIMAKIEAGEDFLDLMDAYGEDPGMQSEPNRTQGYILCEASSDTWEDNFAKAALALEKVGDISEPVWSSYGAHIIRYEYDLTPGAVPYEDVAESMRADCLAAKQDTVYNDQIDAWVAEAEIVRYVENMQ